ncbi:MAG: NUDIX hydrolase [Lautropia sp.]|nr:NUDIX hydrolase [Lautropia sp.]
MAIFRIFRDLLGFRPRRLQAAALCLRGQGAEREVLLVTSRGRRHKTKRWILPKGWPISGLDLMGSAEQEAWEEAGVKGTIHPESIGRYLHAQRRAENFVQQVEVRVYRIDDATLADDYPEAGQRERRWWKLEEAAAAVDQPELAALLRKVAAS